jgi:hypothetical protein
MFRRLASLLVAVPAVLLGQGVARGQDLPSAPQPVAVDPNTVQPPAPVAPAPPPVVQTPAAPVLVPPPGPPLPHDAEVDGAALDVRYAPPPGWFVGAEVSLLRPQVRVEHPSETNIDLDWTVSPWVYLGYRFCNGGAFRLAYRYLASDGTTDLGIPDLGTQELHTRLDLNRVDLDYVSREYAPTTHWRLGWELGARLANRFQDEWGTDPSGSVHVGSSFFGAGPHAGVRATWLIGDSGWAWFTRLDGAVLFGSDRFHATFEPVPGLDDFFGPFGFSRRRSETESDGSLETGLSWTACSPRCWLRLSGGLRVEGWTVDKDDADGLFPFRGVSSVGPFFRCELGF